MAGKKQAMLLVEGVLLSGKVRSIYFMRFSVLTVLAKLHKLQELFSFSVSCISTSTDSCKQ